MSSYRILQFKFRPQAVLKTQRHIGRTFTNVAFVENIIVKENVIGKTNLHASLVNDYNDE